MLNKFITSGVATKVEDGKITFECVVPGNQNGLQLTMQFSDEIVNKVKEDMVDNYVVMDVEGFLIPGENGYLNLAPQTVSTTTLRKTLITANA